MNSLWAGLSQREKFLALVTLLAVVGGVTLLVSSQVLQRFDDLGARIGGLEQELINLTEQDRRSASVERAFQDISTLHSSEWTEQEIHDRLREEIYRLALQNPPPEGEESANQIAHSDFMVQIPTLREGVLRDSGEGYREYQISFRVSPTQPANVMKFLERLQTSRQSLRIDGLDISRDPSGTEITAAIDITRTVVDAGPDGTNEEPELVSLLPNGGFEEGIGAPWLTPGCAVEAGSDMATEGATCLAAKPDGRDGQIFQQLSLESGRYYRLEVDITATTDAELSVRDADDGEAFGAGPVIAGDGTTNRYQLVFSPPGTPGETRTLFVPHIHVPNSDGAVYVDNVRLTEVRGG